MAKGSNVSTSAADTGEMTIISNALFGEDTGAERKPVKAAAARLFANGVSSVVWLGILLIAAAFGIVAYSWGQVADTINVGLQVPYLVSGGITALGLLVVGATLINAAVKRQDATARERQIQELRGVLEDIRSTISGR
jgi:hypothetical protein